MERKSWTLTLELSSPILLLLVGGDSEKATLVARSAQGIATDVLAVAALRGNSKHLLEIAQVVVDQILSQEGRALLERASPYLGVFSWWIDPQLIAELALLSTPGSPAF